MSKKQRIEAEDLETLYDLVWGQFKEDREAAVTNHNALQKIIKDEKHLYEECGDTLAKYAELMIKQTSQIVELIKLAHKKHKDDGTLSENDLDQIAKEIKQEE